MSDHDSPPVAHGDRRREVWIEDDERQLSKVRHTWPTAAAPLQEQSEASGEGVAQPGVTDVAVVPEEPSAWEALEDDD